MKKIYFAGCLLLLIGSASFVFAQTVSIASFSANPTSVISENSVSFSYGGSSAGSFKLSLQCPSGVSTNSPEGNSCNVSTSLPNLDGPNNYSVNFVNNTSATQSVTATLTAYNAVGSEQDSRVITVTVQPKISPTVSIASFVVNPTSVTSDNIASFGYGGNYVGSYKLSLQCPTGISASSPEGNSCNISTSLPSLDGPNNYSVKFTNNTSTKQNVTATLTAYNAVGSEQDSRTINFIVLPKASTDSTGGVGTASISSFDLEQTSVPTTLYSNKPAAHIIANFSGENIGEYKITLECPLPTTIAGVEERVGLIESGSNGVSSPSIEGEQCNFTQTGSASLKQFSFILLNQFKTPQSAKLILQSYSWDGTKYVFGDERSKVITVLPL